MSTWRRLATEQFPELKEAIVPVETLTDLYSELSRLLQDALKAGDEATVKRIVSFALWGTRQTRDERFVHGTYDLFMHVVQSPTLRAALWRQITPSHFADLKAYFHNPYSLALQPTLKELEQEYRFTPRPNMALVRTRHEAPRRSKRRAAARRTTPR